MRGSMNVYRAALKASRTYSMVRNKCPFLMRSILLDLLRIEGMSEVEIAFGAGVSVETVRCLLHRRQAKLPEKDFLAILDFFSLLFYRQRKNK